MTQIEVRVQNVKRGDVLPDGSWVKEVYKNAEKVIITTDAGQDEYFVGEYVTVERV